MNYIRLTISRRSELMAFRLLVKSQIRSHSARSYRHAHQTSMKTHTVTRISILPSELLNHYLFVSKLKWILYCLLSNLYLFTSRCNHTQVRLRCFSIPSHIITVSIPSCSSSLSAASPVRFYL